MNHTWTVCPKCDTPLPNEASVCHCGCRQAMPAAPMNSTLPPLDLLRRRLEQLRAGIGWWQSQDGGVANARAAFVELDVVVVGDQRRVVVIDHLRGKLVSDQTMLVTLEGAKQMAVHTANQYATDEHPVAFAPLPLKPPVQRAGKVLRVRVDYDRILQGKPMLFYPEREESLRDLQARLVTKAVTWAKKNNKTGLLTTEQDKQAGGVWLKTKAA